MLPIEQDVLDVTRFKSKGGPALSVYLDTDPSRAAAGRNLKAQMQDALREMRASLSSRDEARWDEIEAVAAVAMKAIKALRPVPRAVAAFVGPDGFLKVVPLPEQTGRSAHWGPRLHTRPMLGAMDEHERAVVSVVSLEHARVFRVFMGQIAEIASLDHNAPGQQLERTLEAMRLDGDRLLLGGNDEAVQELLTMLPKRFRSRAIVIDGLDVHASSKTVLQRVIETQRDAERAGEAEMVRALAEVDPDRSCFGAAAVAEAVSDGRIHLLMYAATAEMPGTECGGCGWLAPGPETSSCPRCGAAMVAVPELIARLVSRTIQSGGRIEEVRGPAQDTLLQTEGLAALLRYGPS